MTKFITSFVLFISFFFSYHLYSQNPLVAFKQGDEWTFLDSEGNQLFRAAGITQVSGFSEGLIAAQVVMNRKPRWVYFDKSGKIKIKTDAEQGLIFSEGKAVVFNETNEGSNEYIFGFIDKEGKVFKEIKYKDVLSFSEGLAYVMNDKERGYIDHTGKIVIPLPDDVVGYAFSEGLAAVSNSNHRVGYIDKEGKQKIDFILDIPSHYNEGKTIISDTSTGKVGFINKYGVQVIRTIYDEIYPIRDNRTLAGYYNQNYEMKWALLDGSGNILTDFRFDHARSFRNGAAVVMFDSRWGYIDSTGNFLFSENFDFAESFADDGLAWVVDGDRVGFIDKTGAMVIPLPEADYYYDLRLNKELRTTTQMEEQ